MPSLYQPLKCLKFLCQAGPKRKVIDCAVYESVSCLWCVEELRNASMYGYQVDSSSTVTSPHTTLNTVITT